MPNIIQLTQAFIVIRSTGAHYCWKVPWSHFLAKCVRKHKHTLCIQDLNQLNTYVQSSTLKTEHTAERNLGKLLKYHLVLTEINAGVVISLISMLDILHQNAWNLMLWWLQTLITCNILKHQLVLYKRFFTVSGLGTPRNY